MTTADKLILVAAADKTMQIVAYGHSPHDGNPSDWYSHPLQSCAYTIQLFSSACTHMYCCKECIIAIPEKISLFPDLAWLNSYGCWLDPTKAQFSPRECVK